MTSGKCLMVSIYIKINNNTIIQTKITESTTLESDEVTTPATRRLNGLNWAIYMNTFYPKWVSATSATSPPNVVANRIRGLAEALSKMNSNALT